MQRKSAFSLLRRDKIQPKAKFWSYFFILSPLQKSGRFRISILLYQTIDGIQHFIVATYLMIPHFAC